MKFVQVNGLLEAELLHVNSVDSYHTNERSTNYSANTFQGS
jgi:hypothetical protein